MEESDLAIAVPEMLRLARELVPLLLQGDDPRLETLRRQWQVATISISSPSSCGFYADVSLPLDAPLIAAPNQGSGNAEIPVLGADQPAGCILYVVDGRLHFLEVYNVVEWAVAPSFGRPHCIESFTFNAPIAASNHGAGSSG